MEEKETILSEDAILSLMLHVKENINVIDVSVLKKILQENYGLKLLFTFPSFIPGPSYFESLAFRGNNYICRNKQLMEYELRSVGVDISQTPYKDILLMFEKYVEDNEFAISNISNTNDNVKEVEKIIIEFILSGQFIFKLSDIEKNLNEPLDKNVIEDLLQSGLIMKKQDGTFIATISNEYINALKNKKEKTF